MLFLKPIYSILLTIFRIPVSSGQLGKIYLVIAIISYIFVFSKLIKNKLKTTKNFAKLIAIGLLFIFSSCLTFLIHNSINSNFYAEFLSYGSASICAMLLGYSLIRYGEMKKLGRMLPIIILSITITCFITVLTGEKTYGLLNAQNNLDYQNAAYYASYALGLDLYYLFNYSEIIDSELLIKKKVIYYIMPVLQLFTVFSSGGRGGMILALVIILYFAIQYIRQNDVKSKLSFILIFLLVIGIVYFFSIGRFGNQFGFKRLESFLSNPFDSERFRLMSTAYNGFKNSPIIGHGTGSIFYLMNIYSHNIFVDFIYEYGIIGFIILLLTILSVVKNMNRLTRMSSIYSFGILIFIYGITFLMFSAYYLSEQTIWFSLGFSLACVEKNKVIDKEENRNEKTAKNNCKIYPYTL